MLAAYVGRGLWTTRCRTLQYHHCHCGHAPSRRTTCAYHVARTYVCPCASDFGIFSFAADDSLSGSPALDANGTVYIGDWGGTLYAVNGSSGVLLWRYRNALGAFKGSPAITANGTIVIGSLDGAVYGIAGARGFSVCLRRLRVAFSFAGLGRIDH